MTNRKEIKYNSKPHKVDGRKPLEVDTSEYANTRPVPFITYTELKKHMSSYFIRKLKDPVMTIQYDTDWITVGDLIENGTYKIIGGPIKNGIGFDYKAIPVKSQIGDVESLFKAS